MPILDMPLYRLKEYQGRNPRPSDIDAFWDASIAEMEALGTDCELIPASFQVPGMACYDMYFTGMGNARIHARVIIPGKPVPLPAICHFHGCPKMAPEFSALMHWAAVGFVVAAMDCRGQGGQSEDVGGVKGNTYHGHIIRGAFEGDPAKLLYRQIFLDAAQLARIVMALPQVDAKKVGAVGASQGGGLTLACAALTPSLNRAAATYPYLCDYQRVWEMDMDKDAYAELRTYFRQFDPLHEREEEFFTHLGYIDNQHLAHRIQAKVIWFLGQMDTLCPPSTQFAAYNKLTCEKQMFIYPDYKHETLPGTGDKTVQFMLEMLAE